MSDVQLLPSARVDGFNIDAEVVEEECELVFAIEVADGDVAFLSGKLRQVGSVHGIFICDHGLRHEHRGEVFYSRPRGRGVDGEVLIRIVL